MFEAGASLRKSGGRGPATQSAPSKEDSGAPAVRPVAREGTAAAGAGCEAGAAVPGAEVADLAVAAEGSEAAAVEVLAAWEGPEEEEALGHSRV